MRLFQTTYRDSGGVQRTAPRWYVEFRWKEKVRRLPAYTDKRASQAFSRQLEKLAARCSAGEQPDLKTHDWLEKTPLKTRQKLAGWGLLDAHRVGASKPLRNHLADYKQALLDSGTTPEYAQKTYHRVTTMLDGMGIVYLSELDAAAVVRSLAGKRAKRADDKKGLGVKTTNHYLAAIKGFVTWLVKERRASHNPLAHLSCMNAKADRRHVRRPLEPEELITLLATTRCAGDSLGMTGEERNWLYRLAVETGLRSNELRSLLRANFDLDSAEPTVTIDAASAKNGRSATLPLRAETAAEFRAFLGQKHPAAQVFRLPRPEKIVVMLRADLTAAGIPYRDSAGRVADFHSFRVTFATLLLRSGVDVRTAKELMRHATINMTADVYACTLRGSLHEGVKRLPSFSTLTTEAVKATGTNDAAADLVRRLALPCAQQSKTDQLGSTRHDLDNGAQPTKKTGTYDAPLRTPAHGNAGRSGPALIPPRGFEPLSPA